ncbi:MAG: peptide chain release factor-like protein [Chloroflexi bacterium]|nr:peptide chain release factor-like protein [Chloroflexota bacterium]MDA1148021.1 peptide chain release factor-like protein [Chloroflexota bacterium]
MADENAMPDWTQFLRLEDGPLLAQCEMDRYRASGPGGQKRNKTDSAVRLRHRLTGLSAEAVESRSQHENRARALRRLRLEIALTARAAIDLEGGDHALPLDRADRAGELAEALRVGKGRAITMGRRDARYPAVVAGLFDVLAACGWEIGTAAASVGVSTSVVGRFLEAEPVVWRAVQQRRQAAGLSPLRARG